MPGNTWFVLQTWAKTVDGKSQALDKYTADVLLNGHIVKLPFKHSCLGPPSTAILSLGQRSFFLQNS